MMQVPGSMSDAVVTLEGKIQESISLPMAVSALVPGSTRLMMANLAWVDALAPNCTEAACKAKEPLDSTAASKPHRMISQRWRATLGSENLTLMSSGNCIAVIAPDGSWYRPRFPHPPPSAEKVTLHWPESNTMSW